MALALSMMLMLARGVAVAKRIMGDSGRNFINGTSHADMIKAHGGNDHWKFGHQATPPPFGWLGYPLADPTVGLLIAAAILMLVW